MLRLHPDVTRLSWLDAAMGATSTAALVVALGSDAALAVAVGGVVGVIALSRWRPAQPVVVALAGVAALGAGEGPTALAAVLVGGAAWLPARTAHARARVQPRGALGDPRVRDDRAQRC